MSDAPSTAIGVVVVSHCNLATELLRTAELIVGPMEEFYAISIQPDMSHEAIVSLVEQTVREADKGKGVLILTDIFGGTPTNIALAISNARVDVVCGVNLPMIIKAYSLYRDTDLRDLASQVQDYGRRHIARASEILEPSQH